MTLQGLYFLIGRLILILLCAGNAYSVFAAATATLRLSRNSLLVGEVTRLQIAVEGAVPQQVVSFPTFSGLAVSYTGVGQEFISQNGQNSQRYILNYNLTGTKPGNYQVPSLEVKTSSGLVALEPFAIQVVENTFAGKAAFLKLVTSRTEVYVGELFQVEMMLYVTQAENIDAPQLKSDGFVIGKQLPHTKGQSQIENQLYNTFSFKSTIAAAKAGELTLGPAEGRLTVLIPSANQDFFMSRFERHPTELKSDSIRINVLPLPVANKPKGFSGAIGQFSITRQATPQTLSAGDPITLKYLVQGEGAVETLSLPPANWRDFKVYDATSNFTANDPLSLKGTKTLEQVVVPEHSQIDEIPSLDFSFFDPLSKEYQTITLDAIPIEVKPSLAAAAPVKGIGTNGSTALPEAPRDIVHIKNNLGPKAASVAWYQKPWVWGLQMTPVLAFMLLLAWRRREDRLADNPALRRQIELRAEFQRDLREIEKIDATVAPSQFFSVAFRLLQTWLGLKTGITPGGITESVVDDLGARGLPTDEVAQLHQVFQICNQAKYAPGGVSGQSGPVLAALQNLAKNLEPMEPRR